MTLPKSVQAILATLHHAGFEAYVVGGSVRDILLGKTPKDWDVATSATPEEIQALFPKHFYTNTFGTVTVLTSGDVAEVEVTTYRVDGSYRDARHPDAVEFTRSLVEDLARRDFTINALAATSHNEESGIVNYEYAAKLGDLMIIDPFGGIKDLNAKVIRAVGNPTDRFAEDALRPLRAVRFLAQLQFEIEPETLRAITAAAATIRKVSQERVRDELTKIVLSQSPERGMKALEGTGLLEHILPELQEGVGVTQNKHHVYTVFEHNIKSLQFAADFDYPLHVRWAALLHDVGKPRTKRPKEGDFTFYAHEIVGARMARAAMARLRFPKDMVEQVTHLIRHHMFYYDIGKVTEAGARRLLRRVGGREKFEDLVKLRIAERKGSGVPKAEPYRLRHLQFLIDKASQEPIAVGQLAIKGGDLVKDLGMTPGPAFGGILNALLAEVLDDPTKNTREYLLQRAAELKDKDPAELKKLGEAAVEAAEQEREEDIRKKYHV